MAKEDLFKELLAESEARLKAYIADAGVGRIKPYKVKELATDWGCSEPTIYSMLNEGTLEAFYIGKGTSSLRITAESVSRNEASRRYISQHDRSPVQRKVNSEE